MYYCIIKNYDDLVNLYEKAKKNPKFSKHTILSLNIKINHDDYIFFILNKYCGDSYVGNGHKLPTIVQKYIKESEKISLKLMKRRVCSLK